jgi:hypothetical protein
MIMGGVHALPKIPMGHHHRSTARSRRYRLGWVVLCLGPAISMVAAGRDPGHLPCYGAQIAKDLQVRATEGHSCARVSNGDPALMAY